MPLLEIGPTGAFDKLSALIIILSTLEWPCHLQVLLRNLPCQLHNLLGSCWASVLRLVESVVAWCCSEASHATTISLVLKPAMPATGTVEKLAVLAAILLVLTLAMLATGTVEKLAVLATILLVLRLAMPATDTVEKLAMMLLVLRLAMPVPPCWPCQLLLARHAGYSLLVIPCQLCWILFAGHTGHS